MDRIVLDSLTEEDAIWVNDAPRLETKRFEYSFVIVHSIGTS